MLLTMSYDVNYFINKFEAIPENMWLTFSRCNRKGQRCAVGWLYESDREAKQSEIGNFNEIEGALRCLTFNAIGLYPAGINNGIYPEYKQSTPKQRILAALYDIKKMQNSVPTPLPEKPKEKIRYVAVAPEIKEKVAELEMN